METRVKLRTGAGTLRGAVKRPKSDIPYTLIANLLIGTIAWWLEDGQQYDSDQVIELTLSCCVAGLGDC